MHDAFISIPNPQIGLVEMLRRALPPLHPPKDSNASPGWIDRSTVLDPSSYDMRFSEG